MKTVRRDFSRGGIGIGCLMAVGLFAACSAKSGPGAGSSGTGGFMSTILGGIPGTAGITGSGIGGRAGIAGTTGSGGVPPTAGTAGRAGMTGTSGATGASGATGTSGATGASGMMGTSGATGTAGTNGAGGTNAAAGAGGKTGSGACCSSGDCLCHGPDPTALTSAMGPFKTQMYDQGVGCVFYPTDAEPPFAAVAIADGLGGVGGCGPSQTGQWGPLYASWGIVTMIVNTGAGDQPDVRGMALTAGIAAFKMENTKSGGPLSGKLSGRYGTSGFSMGGGGTTYAAAADSTLKTDVGVMAWGPVTSGITVPSLFICGDSDLLAGCGAGMGSGAYAGIADTVPKMIVTISSSHYGQPTADNGKSGQYGLAFQKVFLEGDERWRPLLVAAKSDMTNIH